MAKLLCGTGKCNKVIDVSISDQNLKHKCTNCNIFFVLKNTTKNILVDLQSKKCKR